MKNWISCRGKMTISHVGIILCHLALIGSLFACTSTIFPSGTYSMKSDDEYVIEILDDGNFTYFHKGVITTRGTYAVQGDEFTVETDRWCDSIDSGKAIYIWAYENDILSFTLKGEDHCEPRRELLNNVTYVKEPSNNPIQQNIVKEEVEIDSSAGEVITPENVDQITGVEFIATGGTVYSVAYSPDGRLVAIGTHGTVKLWDSETKTALWLKGHNHNVLSLAFSPDGNMLASGGREDSTIRLWDTASGETLSTLEAPTDYVESVVFSPDGSVLAAAGYSIHTSQDDFLILWDVKNQKLKHSLDPNIVAIRTLAFSPDGQVLASGGSKGVVLWDTVSGERLRMMDAHTNSVVFSPDGHLLASGGATKDVIIWEVESGQQIRKLEGYNSSITGLAFSPDGRLLVTSGCNDIVFWEVTSGTVLHTFSGYKPDGSRDCNTPISPVAFSPDGRLLATGGDYPSLRLWGVP